MNVVLNVCMCVSETLKYEREPADTSTSTPALEDEGAGMSVFLLSCQAEYLLSVQ